MTTGSRIYYNRKDRPKLRDDEIRERVKIPVDERLGGCRGFKSHRPHHLKYYSFSFRTSRKQEHILDGYPAVKQAYSLTRFTTAAALHEAIWPSSRMPNLNTRTIDAARRTRLDRRGIRCDH